MNRTRLLTLIEIAILTAMAFILGELQLFKLPQGGSVSLVMVPIVILSFRRGIIAGLISGFMVGILKIFFGGYILYPLQVILDYPLPFALVGLAGMFTIKKKKAPIGLFILGIIIAGGLKWFCHVLSGVIFFGEYAWEGWNVWPYSMVYNSTFVIPETIIAIAVVIVFYFTANHLFQPKK